jgi:hypothetical protein
MVVGLECLSAQQCPLMLAKYMRPYSKDSRPSRARGQHPTTSKSGCCAPRQIRVADVSQGSKADLTAPKYDFRFTPENRLKLDITACPKSAMSGSGVGGSTFDDPRRPQSVANSIKRSRLTKRKKTSEPRDVETGNQPSDCLDSKPPGGKVTT